MTWPDTALTEKIENAPRGFLSNQAGHASHNEAKIANALHALSADAHHDELLHVRDVRNRAEGYRQAAAFLLSGGQTPEIAQSASSLNDEADRIEQESLDV